MKAEIELAGNGIKSLESAGSCDHRLLSYNRLPITVGSTNNKQTNRLLSVSLMAANFCPYKQLHPDLGQRCEICGVGAINSRHPCLLLCQLGDLRPLDARDTQFALCTEDFPHSLPGSTPLVSSNINSSHLRSPNTERCSKQKPKQLEDFTLSLAVLSSLLGIEKKKKAKKRNCPED